MGWKLWILALVVLVTSCTSITQEPTTTSVAPATTSTSRSPATSTTTTTALATTTSDATTTTTEAPAPILPTDPGRIVYVEYSSVPVLFSEVFTMNPDGSDQRQMTFDGGSFLGQADVGLEEPIDVYSSNGQPRWLSEGNAVAYLAAVELDRNEIRTVDADGGDPQVLFSDWKGSMPSWFPEYQEIAYTTDKGLWVGAADNTESSLYVPHDPTVIGPAGPTTATSSAKWSADGRWVAFIEATGEGYVAGVEFVTVVEIATGATTRGICVEGRNQYIDWHPEEPKLLISECDGTAVIVESDGSILESLPFSAYAPTWSPTGNGILYNADQPWGQNGSLWYYDVASGTTTLLLESFGGDSMDWQPIDN